MTASEDIAGKLRRKMAGGALFGFAVMAVFAGVAIATAAILRNPNLEGILGGVFGGFFAALLIMGAGAWVTIWLAREPKAAPDPEAGADIEASLKGVLDELERARLETIRQINMRAMLRVPLCVAGGIALATYGQFTGDPPDFEELVALIVVPGLAGYAWASMELSGKYARLYKDKVLPRLAATFGELSYRHAVTPDIASLVDEGVMASFERVHADDEIFGTHRNLPLNIVELKTERGTGKSRRTLFDGLLVTLSLPRDTEAVTAVSPELGGLGNFFKRVGATRRQRIALEDPVFEKIYEVYGNDQVAARALLHPAFMEKFLALGELPDFERPTMLCEGRIMHIAMPKRFGRNLFEPPSFRKPAATRAALVQLEADIHAVVALADSLIDLDHRFEVMARR
ncbi:MAG: DUF3137 domain-containing protein [Hyphomonadaceae bacterium]|nr:DUF3137 domain-containing protein [Hyphomonadaceae bacterium]